jgi:hypothetical protein
VAGNGRKVMANESINGCVNENERKAETPLRLCNEKLGEESL